MILITGANGFLGSWVCHYLEFRRLPWLGVCLPNSVNWKLQNLPKKNILEIKSVDWPKLVQQINPNAIISLDWAGVGNNSRNEEKIQSENIERICRLANAATESKVAFFMSFGSQAENGPINIPADELNYDQPTTSYGRAKISLRLELEKIFEQSSTRFVWGRIFSAYGQLDNEVWLIPSLVNSLLSENEFSLTRGDQKWSYLHAFDFARAVESILLDFRIEGVVNIGHNKIKTIRDVAHYVAVSLGRESLLRIGDEPFREDQVFHLEPIIGKLSHASWSPIISLEDGLDGYISWKKKTRAEFAGIKLPFAPE